MLFKFLNQCQDISVVKRTKLVFNGIFRRLRWGGINMLLLFLGIGIFFFYYDVFAQQESLAQSCQIEKIEQKCKEADPVECRKTLEACQDYYEKESARIEADITKTQQEKKTLQNKISSLNQKIKNLSYQINRSNLIIKDLGIQITDTTGSIIKTSQKLQDSQEKLANILRTIYEEDQKGNVEILLAGNTISSFFDNLVALEIVNSKNKEILKNIKILKTNLEQQKEALDGEKEDLEKMVKIQTLQVEENKNAKTEQEVYLKLTETEYQKKVREQEEIQKKATEIRARIFELIGVEKAPTFGQAYEIAKYIQSVTGVRPAFLLAVLTQESNIGKNVGQCYLKDPKTGAGQVAYNGKTVANVMKPSRDVAPFLEITKELGRDPYNTPVSCPMSFGYGGAMGPAQFIPSTWILYKDKIKDITTKAADPWSIRDSFLGAGVYLKDLGASQATYNAEWKAAMRYFSGSTNSKYSFYGDSVMRIVKQYEADIKALEAAK